MHQSELEQHDLGPHIERIQAASQRCVVGVPVNEKTGSYFGGMPTIDRPFMWSKKDGYPLHFVGQLKCSEFECVPTDDGVLLFFYDNRHWGHSAKDRGHAIVLHQQGNDTATASDLPECEVRSLFGLLKRRVTPNVYQRIDVAFQEGGSYPSLERNLLRLDDEVAEECYMEFCGSIQPLIQIGGFPSPIQSDTMEADCVKAFSYGQSQDWLLLLQLFEVGDMAWGDAGALYWFIHKDDLQAGRFDRVWMVTQCH